MDLPPPSNLPPLRTLFFEDLSVGMTETLEKTVSATDVVGFAQLTGDRNPIHLSEHFAARTTFKKRMNLASCATTEHKLTLFADFPQSACTLTTAGSHSSFSTQASKVLYGFLVSEQSFDVTQLCCIKQLHCAIVRRTE